MTEFEQVTVESRGQWRAWLMAHHTQTESIWLITYKKHCRDRYVSYDTIVEEALCFGWIDSLSRKLDQQRTSLLLSPRRPGSVWSALNKRRLEHLIANDLMHPAGLAVIERAKADGSWSILDEAEAGIAPVDLRKALGANPEAEANFNRFSLASRRAILGWIVLARRPETRAKRIAETVRQAGRNLRANFPESRRAQ